MVKQTNKLTISSPSKNGKQLEFSYMAGRSAKWISHFGKTVWKFLVNIYLSFDLAIPLLYIHSRKTKIQGHSKICMPIFMVTLCMITKNWKQHKFPELMN